MATLKQVLDGAKHLIAYGEPESSEIRFEHDVAYAGDGEDPAPELVEAMEKAGWQHDDLEGCFTLGWGG